MMKVMGECPMGCGETLFLAEDGERLLHDELIDLFGVLAYTRCAVIYSVAQVEKLKREAERQAPHKPATSVGGST